MLTLKKHRRVIGVAVLIASVLVILTQQWFLPVLGNRISDRSIVCFDCTQIGYSALTLETSPRVFRNGGRRELSGETLEELIPEISMAFPDTCEYCVYLMASIFTLPIDSPEWAEAWDTFHTLGRGR